jgi:hypothetical protein
MDIQEMINTMSTVSMNERSGYHVTFGDLIDRLKNADDKLILSPTIKGIGAYRGYYSDIALCTEEGNNAYKTELHYDSDTKDWGKWYEENEVKIDFTGTPKELAVKLELLLGMYFDGYKGGYNRITRDKPLWLATDYGDSSDKAIIQITDKLELITKEVI